MLGLKLQIMIFCCHTGLQCEFFYSFRYKTWEDFCDNSLPEKTKFQEIQFCKMLNARAGETEFKTVGLPHKITSLNRKEGYNIAFI